MSSLRIFETNEFLARLKRLPVDRRKTVGRKIEGNVYPQLREEPHYGASIKKLRDYKPETWRYRMGSWRIFYTIDHKEQVVYVVTLTN